jgi:hypothetical protein
MSDTKSLYTLLLEVMISSKNKRVFIGELSNLTWQIILDDWWASITVGSKRPIPWNHSTHAPLARCNLYFRIHQSSSLGIICIVCHQVLRHPSPHGPSSMGTYMLAKVPIAKLNKLT